MKYSQEIRNPKISNDELIFLMSGKGDPRFGGRPNAIKNIINRRESMY